MKGLLSGYLMLPLYYFCSVGFHTDSSWFFQMAVSRINTGFFKGGIKFIWHYKTEKKKKTY